MDGRLKIFVDLAFLAANGGGGRGWASYSHNGEGRSMEISIGYVELDLHHPSRSMMPRADHPHFSLHSSAPHTTRPVVVDCFPPSRSDRSHLQGLPSSSTPPFVQISPQRALPASAPRCKHFWCDIDNHILVLLSYLPLHPCQGLK
ncbi:hypothetical protein ACOSP7_017653 [Xanthoceras sorbifolium]